MIQEQASMMICGLTLQSLSCSLLPDLPDGSGRPGSRIFEFCRIKYHFPVPEIHKS